MQWREGGEVKRMVAPDFSVIIRALEQSKDGVLITDADLVAPGPRILWVNRAYEALTGYSSSELQGSTPRRLQGPRTDRQLLDRLKETLTRGETFHGETVNYRKDGTPYWVEWDIAPVRNDDGTVEYFVSIQRDVTRRKEVELAQAETLAQLRDAKESLVQAEKMAALAVLVAGLAHEMNTPLGVGLTSATHLQGLLEKARKSMDGGTLTKGEFEKMMGSATRTIDILVNAIRRTTRLVETFKQVAADRDEAPASFFLRPLVEDLWKGQVFMHKGAVPNLTLDIPPDLELRACRGALMRVLAAVVENAFDHAFTERVGALTIAARREDGRLVLDIQDDGPGIPEEDLPKVFDPFFTRARGRGKTGLGLHVAFNLTTRTLGGMLRAERCQPAGSRFLISLPA